MTKIIHYRENCIGCGSCAEIDPENWEISKKDGKANLINSKKKGKVFQKEIDEIQKEKTKQVSEACPTGIIKIED